MLLIWCNIDICRLLIFPPSHALTVDLYIDKVKIGEAQNVKGPLYVLPWKPEQFKSGLHHITAVIKVQIMYCRNQIVEIQVPYGRFLEISLLQITWYLYMCIEKNFRYLFIGCKILLLVIHYDKNFIKILVFISKVQKHVLYKPIPCSASSTTSFVFTYTVYLLLAMMMCDGNIRDEIFLLSWLQMLVNVSLMTVHLFKENGFTIKEKSQLFSLDGTTEPFPLLARIVLMVDLLFIVSIVIKNTPCITES